MSITIEIPERGYFAWLDLDGGKVQTEPYAMDGGDTQVSPSFSRRFARQLDDGTWCVVTESWYVVDMRERGADYRWGVENSTEYLWCSDINDPGSTEINSDREYEYPHALAITTKRDALTIARRYARWATGWPLTHWNGVRP